MALAGSVSLNLSNPTAGGGTPFPLDGSTITADVDVAGKKIAASLVVTMFKADLLMTGDAVYVKAPLLGATKWMKSSGGNSVTSVVTNPAQVISAMKRFLAQPGIAPAKQPNDKVGDQDCYKVTFTVPASMVTGALAAAGSAAPALPSGLTLGDVPVSAWVTTSDQRLTKLALDLPLGSAGTISMTITLSKFDVPVTVSPPPADQIQTTGSG